MSSYFDDLDRQVRELALQCRFLGPENEERFADSDFLDALADLEDEVIKTVSLATGDREFPDDLREKIQRIIARWRVRMPWAEAREEQRIDANAMTNTYYALTREARDWALTMKSSRLFSELHRAFHEVAGRRIKTRFGLLFDDPEGIVRRRDRHDLRCALAGDVDHVAAWFAHCYALGAIQAGYPPSRHEGPEVLHAAAKQLAADELDRDTKNRAVGFLRGVLRTPETVVDAASREALTKLASELEAQEALE